MSNYKIADLDLSGNGAAYVRVSDEEQDVSRQHTAIHSFLQRHNASIAKHCWFEDKGWARDTANQRPEFQRLMKLAETGEVKWIVVSERDRFGTTDADEFMHYRYLLRRWGCRLYDASGKDWTGDDIATVIHAVVEGDRSKEEQHHTSKRVLGKFVEKVRNGEWTGGPVRLGFDVACFAFAEPSKERWRVVLEGRDKRVKIYPDGRTERFDGRRNFPPHNDGIEYMQLVPSKDQSVIDAVVSVFNRYATESIGFTTLSRYLNDLGFRSCFGGEFQGCQIEEMLQDPIYTGYPAGNRKHCGKFHRYKDGTTVLEPNPTEKQTRNDKADWIYSQRRLFDPLVDPKMWAAVQKKLEKKARRVPAPRSARQYLAGLVYCAHCGKSLVGGPGRQGRLEYFCGTYFFYARKRRCKESPCRRNGVFQDELESIIQRYLDETGQRLDLLMKRPNVDVGQDSVTGKLDTQERSAWSGFLEGIQRLCDYLMRFHPHEYDSILEEDASRAEEERAMAEEAARSPGLPIGSLKAKLGQRFTTACDKAAKDMKDGVVISVERHNEFVGALLKSYRANFDPEALTADIERLDAEHTALTQQCLKLTSPLAIDKANKQLGELEARLAELKGQQQDAAAVVEKSYHQLLDLQAAIASAKMDMTSQRGERSWRLKAESLRAIIQRIECSFSADGIVHGPHGGRRTSRLAAVTIYPLLGEAVKYDPVLLPYSGVSRKYRSPAIHNTSSRSRTPHSAANGLRQPKSMPPTRRPLMSGHSSTSACSKSG